MATELPSHRQGNHDASSPSVDELAASFPQFEIKRLIGRGGMGMIYHARQKNLERDVAIKVIDRRFPRDSEFFDRFEREAKALAKFSHPNVVTIFDYGHTESGQAYLVMEYVHGLNLREAMEAMTIELEEAISIVKQVCIALQYAHAKGVVHRDIKPENILLGEDGTVKIADFGIARIVENEGQNRLTATQQVLGTFHYLAPEQIESPAEADHRVDIYALGVILYELLTRKMPIGNFEVPSQIVDNLDRGLDEIVLKSLQRRPTVRFQSAEELRLAIETIPLGSSRQPSAIPTIEPISPAGPKHFNSTVSTPFESEDMAGFAVVLGSIQAMNHGLRLEYRIRDAIFGTLRTKVRTVEIPYEQIVRMEFRSGPFKGKLAIIGNSLSSLQNFPGSETGRIEVKVKRTDYELAQQMLDRIHAIAPSILPFGRSDASYQNNRNAMVAMSLIFFAILNAGTLAILQIIFASELERMPHAISAVAAAVMFGPIIVTQLVTGLVHAITGSREAARVGAIASMFPVTPVAILGIPFGRTTQKWLDDVTTIHSAAPSLAQPTVKPKSWGATTLVFMRDARNARLVALLETMGTAVVIGGFAIYFFGLYPSQMSFRVVGQSSQETLEPLILKRLRGVDGAKIRNWDESQFQIECWQFQQSAIAERLALSTAPNMRFLVASKEDGRGEHEVYLPSKVEATSDSLVARSSGTGIEYLSSKEMLELKEEFVSQIRVEKDRQVTIELSKEGWRTMQSLLQDNDKSGELGLEVEGWIEGIAPRKKIQDKTFVFEIPRNAKHKAPALQSAVRGPRLPTELEWLR